MSLERIVEIFDVKRALGSIWSVLIKAEVIDEADAKQVALIVGF